MRKILTLTGSYLLALSLAACGASNAGSDKSQTPSKKPAIQTGIISASEDTEKPELKNEEKAVEDSKALEEKWRKTAKEFAKTEGVPTKHTFYLSSFASFSKEKMESYWHSVNYNDKWKTGDKVKVTFYCQTKEPVTTQILIFPQGADSKGQLTKFGCGVDKPAKGEWEYTLPQDAPNLVFYIEKRPVEGFFILNQTKI